MKSLLWAALGTIAVASAAAAATGWPAHRFEEAGFAVEAPEDFAMYRLDNGPEGAPMRGYRAAQVGDMTLTVAAIDGRSMSAETWALGASEIADLVVASAVEGGQLHGSLPFTVEGGAGRNVRMDVAGKVVRSRVMVRRPWIVSASVAAPPSRADRLDSAEAEQFLGSLTLLEPPAG